MKNKLNLKGQFNNSQTAVNPDSQPTVNRRSRLMSVLCLLTLLTLGVGQMWGATIFNCGIDINDTWYKGTGTINSGNWLGNKGAFNSANLGVLTSLKLGGQYDTWDGDQTDECSWSSNNGIWITIKKGSTEKVNFKLSTYHSGKDGNNNVWKTTGTTGTCGDGSSFGMYTCNISSYAPGDDYTIKASWTSPSSQSTQATASFTIPGFTGLSSTSVTFDNTTVGSNNSKSITYTHYGTAPTNVAARYSITGTNADQFSITALSGTGATIKFTPTSAGTKTASLEINDVHGKTTGSITLTGTTKHTITFAPKGTYGTSTVTATAAGAAATSGNSYAYGSTIVYTASPASGYFIEGWYSDADCTVSLSNGTNTTYTISSLNANSTVYVKFMPFTISATMTPTTGATGVARDFTFHITSNAPLNSGYYVGVYNFGTVGSGTHGDGEMNGIIPYTSSPTEYSKTGVGGFASSGTYTTQAFLMKESIVLATSDALTYSAGNYYTVSFNMNGHGSAVSPQNIASGSTVTTPSPAPTATGYNFGGWYENAECTGSVFNFSTAITANKTLYAKWTPKTTTVTLNQQSGTGGTANVTATYDAAMPAATMPTRDNYTFNGYFTGAEGSGTKYYNANGTSAKNWDIEDATKTLYASWTETKYDVTVSVSNPSAAAGTIACTAAGWVASNNGTAQIGNATDITITAGAAASGYTWGSWVLSGGVTLVSGELTNPSITVKATATGSATFTYAEDLSTGWYIAGDAPGTTAGSPFTGWGTSGTRMYKKAGYSNVEKYYCTISVSTVATTDNHFPFQVFDGTNHRGYNGYWITKENNTTTVYTNNPTNMKFRPYLTGTYEFEVDNTGANPVLTVHWPVINQLRISSASPSDGTNTGNFDLTDQGSNNWSVTRSLKANTTYTFKMVFDGEWYGKNSTNLTRASSTATGLSASGANMTVKTDVAGEYTFTFNSSSKNLSITYPTAYTVTYGVGTSYTSMGSVSVSPSFTSGHYVLAGTNITFTATPNLGYKFVGWYNKAACTGDAVSTSATYTIASLGANTTLYAKFDYRDLYIHNDWTSYWGTPVPMTQSNANRAVYTYTYDNMGARASAQAGDGAWNTGYHFRIMNAANGEDGYLAYNYDGVQTPTYSGSVDAVHKTADKNPTIEFGLTQKSFVTITLTLQSTNDATKPTVNIAADPYYTITTAKGGSGAAGITISPASVEARSGANSAEIIATIAQGYTFVNWTADAGITINSPNATTTTIKATGAGTLTANATANHYAVHFNGNGNTGGSMDDMHARTYGVAFNLTANGFTKTGYSFDGWATTADGAVTYANEANVSNLTPVNNGTATLYAKWSPVAYSVTLDGDEEHNKTAGTYALTGGTATFDAALPSFTGTLPTAADGYAFMGFYSEQNGNGVQVIDANGAWIATAAGYTSGGNWVHEGNTTLYAYFKKAEITAVELSASILDQVAAGGTGFITANPTIAPRPSGTTKVCWELLYDNDNPVEEHNAVEDPDGSHPNRVKFSIAGLAAGGYKIKATLALGNTCPATPADVLSEREVSFTIASGYTVTIQYKDASGNTIASSTTSPGKATDWTSISAPEIFGYTFSTWVPGDGITLESPATTNSNQFKATFNGTLTAQYTKNKYIYLDLSQKFSGSGYWNNPWVYFYNGDPWDATNGTGATGHSHYISGHAMTQIGDSKIWYFDYGSVSNPSQYIAFTWDDKHGQDNFNYTDVIFRGDFTEGTPLFVPTVGQTMSEKNTAKYYNKGYWTNYVGDKTGYSVIIYDGSDNELKRQRFTSVNNDMRMTMKAALDLDAATTYRIEILRDNGKYYKKNSTLTSTNCTNLDFTENATKGRITSTAAGSYIFTLNYSPSTLNGTDFELRLTVDYPAAANDFQILYNDNAEWSLGSAHDENWVHPSRVIRARAGGVDTISFFVAKGDGIAAKLKARKVNSINASTGAITWGSLNINEKDASQSLTVDSAAVWNFKVTQGTTAGTIASIVNIGAYTGNYYIRCNALNSNWDNYTTDGDHRMTYSSFSESAANSFGEKYSHYKAKWCPRNTNIAFCIANDYSPCITDTLVQDVPDSYSNTESDGTLKYEKEGGNMKYNNDGNAYLDRYSANVRFMWNRKTNKISRAYVSAATSGLAQFLVLRAGQELHHDDNTAISSTPENSVLLHDNENWIYEAKLMIKPSTRFKLYACYAKSPVDPASAQYFRGAYDDNKFTSDENSVILIGGESVDYQLARIVYDFKTNRLIAAWMPSGEVDGDNAINADVMIIREHQESARCITFANSSANLSGVKTVYGVMKFNRWILNNRGGSADEDKDHARPDHIAEDLANYHAPLTIENQKSTYERRLYFISFPFNVRVGDIFGFGQYGSYWALQYYDGLSRAKNGYWLDSKPNWKYISPTQVANGYTLKANEGYILELNLSAMAADNTTFWSNGISTIELYFPSTVAQETLKQTNCTIPALNDDYKCTINRGTAEGDRRVKDSYWRCIGVPSYNLYNSALKDGSGNTISWKTDYTWYNDEREFPFIYMWNKTDNTLTPQSTSTFLFQPMHAYLTQIKSAIVWTAVSAKPSSIVARRARKEANNEHEWRIELRQDTTFLDQTYVRMTNLEQVTDSFDFGQDLVKELNSRSNIYTFIGYEKVAANSMTVHTDQTTVIPVGANIRADGEYTFAMPEGTNGVGITLIDTEANVRTSLSALDYTVTLSAGEYTNRFFLEISPVQNMPTDLGNVQGDNVQGTKVRKVMIDGILYIVKDGKMYDARGARVE